jgi:ATP phosphoribosyltransferase regulatory subunit
VLHTRPDGFAGSRSPLQVGAELFGHAGIESDVEILSLVLESLALMDVADAHVDLGHVGIFRALADEACLDARQETALFDALQRKAATEIRDILATCRAGDAQRQRLACLAELNGETEVLARARERLGGAGAAVLEALDDLSAIASRMRERNTDSVLFFDLAELRGYNFHTGMVFAVFVPGYGQEIARGGRYDDIGEVFGRARAATGFSMDLKTLVELGRRTPAPRPAMILAPAENDPALLEAVRNLRARGERVVYALPGQTDDPGATGCERRLVREAGGWAVRPL